MSTLPPTDEVDPFDLPEWLGDGDVTWAATSGVRSGHLVSGALSAGDGAGVLACDLLAVDAAFPRPVVAEETRTATHQAWHHGQVLLGSHGARMALLVPGTHFTADLALDALARLAKAVGAAPERYAVRLRIGD